MEKTGSSIPCSEIEAGSGLPWPLLRDQLCDLCKVHIGFLLTKLSFDLRGRSVLPYKGSGNIFESAGQNDLQRLWFLRNGAGQISPALFSVGSRT